MALTQEQADRLAKWRWGWEARATYGYDIVCVWPGAGVCGFSGRGFEAALRAPMQSPMTDRDAELEAKIRWGFDATAWVDGSNRIVGPRGAYNAKGLCGLGAPWEKAFEDADRREAEQRAIGTIVGVDWAYRGDSSGITYFLRARPLTRPDALIRAQAIWGPDAYAFEAIGDAPLTVGKAGIGYTGKTFEEALGNATTSMFVAGIASAGRAAVREENKRQGQRLIEQCPKWAYPLGWRLAVMAAVEWCNGQQPAPFVRDDRDAEALDCMVRMYHDARLQGRSVDSVLRSQRPGTMWDVALWAYERGRGAPGGPR